MRKTLSDYVESIKLQLFGGVLESEIPDSTIEKLILEALEEVNRYYTETDSLEVAGSSCIDLVSYPQINNVVNVFRTSSDTSSLNSSSDPVYLSQLQYYTMGSGYYSPQNVLYNIGSQYLVDKINSVVQGPDLQFYVDKRANKLYISLPKGVPSSITIEYTPVLRDVSEVVGDFWEDILMRLALAHTKVALGRVRTRYTQTGAIWQGDGDKILEEGKNELKELRDRLRDRSDILLPID